MNDALLEAAHDSFRAGDLESAAQRCYAALRTDETNLRAIFLLGVIHFQRAEFVEAERVMAKGLAIDPSRSTSGTIAGPRF
jgi:Flp pilus assembly protein TadD